MKVAVAVRVTMQVTMTVTRGTYVGRHGVDSQQEGVQHAQRLLGPCHRSHERRPRPRVRRRVPRNPPSQKRRLGEPEAEEGRRESVGGRRGAVQVRRRSLVCPLPCAGAPLPQRGGSKSLRRDSGTPLGPALASAAPAVLRPPSREVRILSRAARGEVRERERERRREEERRGDRTP